MICTVKVFCWVWVVLLIACVDEKKSGNNIDQSTISPEQTVIETPIGGIKNDRQSADHLVFNPSFDFSLDRIITIEMTMNSEDRGFVHIYHQRVELENVLMPDPTARILSFDPYVFDKVDLLVGGDATELILLWMPMKAEANQQVVLLGLEPEQSSYSVVLN